MLSLEQPATAASLDSEHSRFLQLGACLLGALQQHTVEIQARINH